MIPRPQPDECHPYYHGYINQVPVDSDLWAIWEGQGAELTALLQNITEEQASQRPAPTEWSIKEVVGHICDTERIFAYRILRIGRGDATPLPGFEQDDYVNATNFNTARTLASLVEEFTAQRRANLLCFKPFTEEEVGRRGTASGYPVTVRALLYMAAGHVIHHMTSLKTDYKVG